MGKGSKDCARVLLGSILVYIA